MRAENIRDGDKKQIIEKNRHNSYKKGQCTQKIVQLRSISRISFQVKAHERVHRSGSAVKGIQRLGVTVL
jgi:hypothetical protein